MLVIEKGKDIIYASFQGVKRFTCIFSKDVESELIPFIEDDSRELILDLDGINFIDSVAFDTIINIHNRAKEKESKFELINISSDVKELFELLKLSDILVISEN